MRNTENEGVRSRLGSNLMRGASLGVMALVSVAPAMAQDDSLETVVVTGTLLKGINPPGTNLVTFSAADIKATGGLTTSQILTNIPQLANAFDVDATTGVNLNPSGGSGTANRPKLRNLSGGGGSATLFLVNGHNMVGVGFLTTTPDGGEIPAMVLQRVDVIADGGSALYGSDAVAGTINFITRTSYEGLYGETHYGSTTAGDYDTFQMGIMGGHAWSSGNAYMAYEYRNNSPQFKRDRSYLRQNLKPLGGTVDNRGKSCPGKLNVTVGSTNYAISNSSIANTPGSLKSAVAFSGATSSADPATAFNLCDTGLDTSSFDQEYMHSFFGSFSQHISDGIDFNMVAWFGRRVSTQYIAGPVGNGLTIDNSNPFFQAIGTETQQTVYFSYQQFTGSNYEAQNSTLEQYQVEPELKLQLGGSWTGDVLLNYGRSAVYCYGGGCGGPIVDQTTQANALRYVPTALGAFPLVANNALDPYNLSQSNPTLLNQLVNWGGISLGIQQQMQFRAEADGELFDLPAGPVKVAAGLQYAYESITGRYLQGDNAQRTGVPSLGGLDTVGGAHRYIESLFGEVFVPLVSDQNELPFVHALNLDVSARFDHYSDFGGTTNPKIGLTYQPIAGLSIRGNMGTSFNAPSLADSNYSIDARVSYSPTTAATRVPAVGSLYGPATVAESNLAQQRPSFFFAGGTPGIIPQKANTWSYGFDYAPDFIDGLNVSLTKWHISLYHAINMTPYTSPSVLFTPAYSRFFKINPTLAEITAATTGANFIAVTGLPLITAYQTPGVTPYIWVDARRYNLGNQYDSGLDFNVHYDMPTSFGSMEFGFGGTDYTQILLQAPSVAGVAQPKLDDLAVDTSPYQISAFVGGQWGPLHARATFNYSAGFTLRPGSLPAGSATHAPSYMPVNLALDYDLDGAFSWSSGATASLNINNLLDTNPPFYNSTSGLNRTGPAVGGTVNGVTLGRLFTIGLTKKF